MPASALLGLFWSSERCLVRLTGTGEPSRGSLDLFLCSGFGGASLPAEKLERRATPQGAIDLLAHPAQPPQGRRAFLLARPHRLEVPDHAPVRSAQLRIDLLVAKSAFV